MFSDARIVELFNALAEFPDVGAAVCWAAAEGRMHGEKSVKQICTAAGIAQDRSFLVEKILKAGAGLRAFRRRSITFWATEDGIDFSRLAALLEGAALYLNNVHVPENSVDVVLTLPPSPCRLEVALQGMGYRSSFIEDTQEIFSNLAASARHRFLVMTPFMDEEGGARLLSLFGRVADGVEKQLVVRCQGGKAPEGLRLYDQEFRTLGVQVSNYWIPKGKPGNYETFHAKVMLADASRCYVGSANMTDASINFSMELGMLVEGEAAKTVGWMCDAILDMIPLL